MNLRTKSMLLIQLSISFCTVSAFTAIPTNNRKLFYSTSSPSSSSSLFYSSNSDLNLKDTNFIDINDLQKQQQEQQQFNNFVRLKKSSSINSSNNGYELQTCVTTLQNKITKQKIEIHGVVHFGTKDYFTYFNNKDNCNTILYEFIVPQSFLTSETNIGTNSIIKRRLNREIISNANDQSTSLSLGLECQANIIDFHKNDNWYCADLTKEELDSLEELGQSKKSSIPGAELLSAFFQPISPTALQQEEQQPKTRLFSNLFLPGTSFTSFLRYCLWLGLPAPDLSILLLDYSSIFPRPKGDSMISPIASTVLESLVKGDIQTVRQLLFANIIVSSHFRILKENDILVKRNNYALDVLYSHLEYEQRDNNNDKENAISLIYGVHHCPDILNKLLQYDNNQYVVTDRSWRTAFAMPSTTTTATSTNNNLAATPSFALTVTTLIVGYLSLSAFDWFSLLQSFALAFESKVDIFEISFDVVAYILRHIIVYLTLVKFLIQWDDRSYFSG